MTATSTWAECAAMGMTQAEAARHRGVSRVAAWRWSQRSGVAFRRIVPKKRRGSVLSRLTPAELAAYRICMDKGKYRRAEALAAIGRTDLIAP
jgi:hypothetical protein